MSYRPIPVPSQAEQVIGGINTTPLIDVMLVLLVMFIMIIPVTNHKVAVDLPQGDTPGVTPTIYRLDLTGSGALLWNGIPVAEAELPRRLSAVAGEPKAVLHFRTEGEARYEIFDRVLADVKRAGIERLGLVDNARFVEQ